MTEQASWLAPAKINLALHVTGRRDDGYHLIETLAVFTRFGDRLTVFASEADGFEITGPFAAGLSTDDSNLVIKARDRLRGIAPAAPTVSIRLEKNLPVASGVGGGSSDAAAALKALASFWTIDSQSRAFAEIAAGLGADVPMCLAAEPLVARGIGDDLTLIPNFPPLGLVLVNPGAPVATKDVFEKLSKRDNDQLPPLPADLTFHSLWTWLESTRNDLELPARGIEPSIGKALKTLKSCGAAFARMSGSGATCFGLYESGNMAKRAAADIRKRQAGWFVAATRTVLPEDVSA